VLALPEDVLSAQVVAADVPRVEPLVTIPDPARIADVHRLLAAAKRPLALVGGSRWNRDACALLMQFAQRQALPIACAFRNQDLFDNRHPQYAGDVGLGINPKLAARIRDADVLLVIGERLGEITTGGYELVHAPVPSQTLIHVHPGVEELGRVYQPAVAINATPEAFLAAMNALPANSSAESHNALAAVTADIAAWRAPRPVPGALDLWQVVSALDARLPDDAIVTNGAGNYSVWLHRLYRYRGFRTQLAPYAGSMGYGVPSAVAAKVLHPQRVVVSWNGDGCYLMNGQELATAVQYGLAIVFIVVDNGMYGTIRMHQERHYPARVHGTSLANPDFAALARAYGAHGETVTRTEEFVPAFEAARESGKPALLHLKVDPQALTMNATLDALREQGRAELAATNLVLGVRLDSK